MRALGDWSADLELLIFEAVESHDLQRGEIMALVYNHITVHCPGAIEEYEDGDQPVYYYGPRKAEEK